ncbi:MAG: SDR family oxidoreductase [Pseudomonadota bacterium]
MLTLLCFGYGYVAKALATRLLSANAQWRIIGTRRPGADSGASGEPQGVRLVPFDATTPLHDDVLRRATHIVSSIPPDDDGDVVLRLHGADMARRAHTVSWLGYLSATSVYGDAKGKTVTEETPTAPVSETGRRRAAAETEWLGLAEQTEAPVGVFRLGGIYGPGRNALARLIAGKTAFRITKPGHVLNRIHVDDIVETLLAAMAKPRSGDVYNVVDNAPASAADVIAYAAELLGRPAPPAVPFEKAELSPAGRRFFEENKHVDNGRIKQALGVVLAYPTYREGLNALYKAGAAEKEY